MVAKDRDVWLDFIRALAIMAVTICHFASFYAECIGVPPVGIYAAIGLGGFGVDLFFVLSGWLLGGILLQEISETGNLDLKNFYRKRWLRTLPCYFAVLAGTLAQRMLSHKFQLNDLVYLGFLQTYFFDRLEFLSISWSLCVEEHFYLLIAPCLFLLRRSKRQTACALFLLILVPIIFRSKGWFHNTWQTHVRIDQCTLGVLLAFLRNLNPDLFQRTIAKLGVFVWGGVCLLMVMFFFRLQQRAFFMEQEWIAPIAGLFVVQSVCPLSGFTDRFCRSRVVQYLASRSYCLYFCHVEAMYLLKRVGVKELVPLLILFPPVCLLLTEFLHRVIERPFMALKHTGSVSTLFAKGSLSPPDRIPPEKSRTDV